MFTTEKDAEEALKKEGEKNYAEIYVERYATKLTFDATEASQTDFVTGQRMWDENGKELTTTNKITLHFNPQYWAVNAEAKKTYVIKSYRKENLETLSPDKYNYTYSALNDIINEGLTGDNVWKWNAPGFFRSYWGMSPAYFTDTYPEVSSDLDSNHSELQKYISYENLESHDFGYAATDKNPHYFRETTVGRKALDSKNPAAAVASVIYVGQYSVKVNGTDVGNPGFYTYLSGPVPDADEDDDNQPYIYFENDENAENPLVSKVGGAESMLKRFLIQCTILYKKEKGADGKDNYVPYELGDGTGLNTLASMVRVSQLSNDERKYYDSNANTELKLQHNARTLRFETVPAADANVYVLTYTGYKKVVTTVTNENTEISLRDANIALAKNVGFALYYTTGLAYFNIPVKHFGWYRQGNENNKPEAIFDWSKVRVGDFGMVRNHAYTVKVGTIKGLASGIGGKEVEIVPPSSETNYYVSYQVHILRWAIVPTQTADL